MVLIEIRGQTTHVVDVDENTTVTGVKVIIFFWLFRQKCSQEFGNHFPIF